MLLFSSLFISCCALLMVMQVFDLFALQQSYNYLLFVFFATLSSYNMHWYFTPFISAEKERSKWSSEHRQVHLVIFIIGAMLAAYFGLKFIDHWQYIAIAVILTFLYSAPKLPIPGMYWLKKIAIGKTLFLTFVWTYVTTILPLLINEVEWSTSMFLFCAGRFFFIYAICIIFDYRDREQDRSEGIRSMITLFNEKGIMTLFYISVLLAILAFIIGYNYGLPLFTVIVSIGTCLILPYLFQKAKRDFSDYLFDLVIDGMMAVPAVITLIMDEFTT